MNRNKHAFTNGMRDGIPIAMGYFAVSFSLGIVARQAGLSPVQGFISSMLNHASAGEYAEFTVIMANAPYLEMAFVILITNIRYLLMSCALSQKFDSSTSLLHRFLVGFGITDEIFGISIARAGHLNPWYTYGAMFIALPSWSLGTALGIIAGNILPASIVSALSVALYGMFIAIIIPPAKKDKVVGGIVIAGFFVSYIASKIPQLATVSDSMKISIITIILSAVAAILFPISETDETSTTVQEEA